MHAGLRLLLAAGLLLALVAPLRAETAVPLLWRAQGEAGTVYLLGAFHLLRASDHPLPDAVEAAWAGADRVVFEVAPEELARGDLAARFNQRGRLPAGQRLSRRVGPETLAALHAHFGTGAALEAVDGHAPWFVGLNVAVTAMMSAGFDPRHGIDHHFMQRVRRSGRPSGGLETVDEQLEALASVPWAEQELALRRTLRPRRELVAQAEALHRSWRSGDEQALHRVLVEDMARDTPETARRINRDRNLRWLPQVREMLDEPRTTLVIVGALHLVGPDGLPALLARDGVRVERVVAPPP